MLIVPLQVGPLQANCYLVATDAGVPNQPRPAVVIDPGMDAAAAIEQACDQLYLLVSAVIATHGHLDHVADAATVADAAGVPVYIHPDDRHLLTHPSAGLSPDFSALIAEHYPEPLAAPAQVADLHQGQQLDLAGLSFTVTQAPGHTAGSVLLTLENVELGSVFQGVEQGLGTIIFTGDVLFAGSIGRTDLPGSDPAAMAHTLATVVAGLDDQGYILPGHGPASQLAHERATNPYVR